MKPLIVFSELGKRWYVVTRYKDIGEGKIYASRKYDVTERMEQILAESKAGDTGKDTQ